MKDIYSPPFEIRIPKPGKNLIRVILLGVLAVVVLYGSIYQVSPEELGVILRFGKFVRTAEPGLHFKLPLGVETLTRVPVQRQLKLEFGFRTTEPGIHSKYQVSPADRLEAIMLTGDLNVVVAEWIVQYKIKDPFKFLFKMREAQTTLRDLTEAVVRRAVGDSSVDEVITIGRARIADDAKEELQSLCDLYEIGIEINQLIFQDVNPPDSVKPSFNEVNEALQEKERKINEAWSEYNQEIPKASGVALQMIESAEGYSTERTNRAMGDASRFVQIYREYKNAPVVTRKRMYLEMIQEVLPRLSKKIIIDQGLKGLLPILNFGEEVKK